MDRGALKIAQVQWFDNVMLEAEKHDKLWLSRCGVQFEIYITYFP